MNTDPITSLDANALSLAIHARTLSCREVMAAYLQRIAQLNPRFNAIVNLAPDDTLLRQADTCDAELAHGESRGWMHGFPQAIKDTSHAAGFPSTLGSVLLKDAVATQDSVMTVRMKVAGCIVIGKTNMPEFGLGSHTFNELFGATPNPWDPTRSAGGSSGGAAVALALRLLPVADGSDFMGSLRNPAGWNHVFGMRPSQGRVPAWPVQDVWVAQLGSDGPMGRSVRDVAQLLQVQAGHDARVPLSIREPLAHFSGDASLCGLRVGWLGNIGGHLAIEAGILPVCEAALAKFEAGGAIVEPISLGFSPEALWQAWLVWRRALVASRLAPFMARNDARENIKPEALWEHDQAQSLGFAQFMQASVLRSAFHVHMLGLFERFDVLALPCAQVWPFLLEQRWPKHIAGREMDTYHRWMEVTLYATFAGLPAISVPAGFDTAGRWPMGLQLIGGPQGDAKLLEVAAAYEQTQSALLSRRPNPG